MPYEAELEVQFGDIDQAGIVYYPRFIHYFHVAMEQFFRDVVGVDYPVVLQERRVGHPTVHLEVDFAVPLRYGDHLRIEVGVEKLGRTSVSWLYKVRTRGSDTVHAVGRVVTVNIDLDSFEKRQIPDWLEEALEGYRAAG